jgi:hypothetical protein
MQQVAGETWVVFERRLERAQVPAPQRPDYHKWTRFHLDFCHKYGYPPRLPTSLGPLLRSDLSPGSGRSHPEATPRLPTGHLVANR